MQRQELNATTAIQMIRDAAGADELFGSDATGPAAERRARRRYRQLFALVHPDVAARHGVHPTDAAGATARLHELYAAWQHLDAPAHVRAAPHVIGARGVYELRTRIRKAPMVSAYATDHENVFVEIDRTEREATERTRSAVREFARSGCAAFGPAVIDHGEAAGHAWVAYRLPAGLHSLHEVRAAYPDGLDGRDWAWIARRIAMALDLAGLPHWGIDLDTVLIEPEQRGVVLVGWGGTLPVPYPGLASRIDAESVARLFDELLTPDEIRQRRFAAAATGLPPHEWLAEYDLLLRAMYVERRYRPFSIRGAA